jgi:hypothetical protein
LFLLANTDLVLCAIFSLPLFSQECSEPDKSLFLRRLWKFSALYLLVSLFCFPGSAGFLGLTAAFSRLIFYSSWVAVGIFSITFLFIPFLFYMILGRISFMNVLALKKIFKAPVAFLYFTFFLEIFSAFPLFPRLSSSLFKAELPGLFTPKAFSSAPQ